MKITTKKDTKITLTLDDNDVVLTEDEAKQIYYALGEALGINPIIYYPPTPNTPYDPPYQTNPWIRPWCDRDKTDMPVIPNVWYTTSASDTTTTGGAEWKHGFNYWTPSGSINCHTSELSKEP